VRNGTVDIGRFGLWPANVRREIPRLLRFGGTQLSSTVLRIRAANGMCFPADDFEIDGTVACHIERNGEIVIAAETATLRATASARHRPHRRPPFEER
jgi:hypothetical protein